MTETPTADEFGDLVGTYEDELRCSIKCAVDNSYYRKSDLTDAADAILDAFDAQAARIAALEAAAREIIAAFPYETEMWTCDCRECIAVRALIALLPKEAPDDTGS